MPTDLPSIPTRRELIRELQPYARADTARGLALFILDIGLYAMALACVTFLQALWAKVGASVFAGMALARMF